MEVPTTVISPDSMATLKLLKNNVPNLNLDLLVNGLSESAKLEAKNIASAQVTKFKANMVANQQNILLATNEDSGDGTDRNGVVAGVLNEWYKGVMNVSLGIALSHQPQLGLASERTSTLLFDQNIPESFLIAVLAMKLAIAEIATLPDVYIVFIVDIMQHVFNAVLRTLGAQFEVDGVDLTSFILDGVAAAQLICVFSTTAPVLMQFASPKLGNSRFINEGGRVGWQGQIAEQSKVYSGVGYIALGTEIIEQVEGRRVQGS